MIDAVMAMTTVNPEREARELASRIVKERLAACVQIVPKIESIYFWDGKVHDDQEYLLLIKTLEARVGDLKAFLEKHHSYEVPEILGVPVIEGSKEYLQWMKDCTR